MTMTFTHTHTHTHAEPPSNPANPGYTSFVRFNFERDKDDGDGVEQWTEEIDLVDLLIDVLAKEVGCTARRASAPDGHWLVTDNGFWLKPQFVEHSHSADAVHTSSTVEVAHPLWLSQPCFEYQHSRSEESATDALRTGFKQWARMDWLVFKDLAASALEHCQSMEIEFPAHASTQLPAYTRKILLGPASHWASQESADPAQDEHPFCPCCLFTNTMPAFMPQLKHTDSFGLRLYAARGDDGEIMADCRVNGEDWEAGAEALRDYVRSWPERGFESRKQYVLITHSV